ncbi:MAG TPA: DUF2530 domain-containing protein [Streptosporangiaceae bacterium]
MATPRRSPPPPLEGNARLITTVITSGWAVALIVVVIVRGSLPPSERWWVWTCVAGVVMGCFGLWYVPRLQRARVRLEEHRATERARQAQQPGPAQRAVQEPAPPENDSKTVSSSETPGRSTRS